VSGARPRLAVFKFASCDGCQLALLNLEARLFQLAERFDLAWVLEASSRALPGPWDVALVEGSITTPRDAARIRELRAATRTLITIGACATAGGIQALRNLASIEDWKREVYPRPDWIEALPTSTAIRDHVPVDYEIHGCPVNPEQVLRVLERALRGAGGDLPGASVCLECKRAGHVCVVVARGLPCLGPVTRAGCGALCPALGRDCYACFGPADDPNPGALARRLEALGLSHREIARRLRGVAGWSPAFRAAAERLEDSGG
jgi:coenzyme F420-reducing hydrogenase gamma subunit